MSFMGKHLVIIDSFVRNETIMSRLAECSAKMKSIGADVLLVSNTQLIPPDGVDYFLYDRRNQLFQTEYTGVRDIDIFRINDTFESHEIKPGLQRHGLSVLVNLFNSLALARSLGYTHFLRVEVDDIFGDRSLEFIRGVPELCESQGKKALFYYNERYESEPSNMSFHFMYSEVEFFLGRVRQIRDEADYRDYLRDTGRGTDFMIAEEYLYDNLRRNGDSEAIIRDGGRMGDDFPDTAWNTIVSDSNINPLHRGVTTALYRVNGSERTAILSYCYANRSASRNVEVFSGGRLVETIRQDVSNSGGWCFHIPQYEFDEIAVYEDGEKLGTERKQNTKNHITFR